MVIRNRCKDRLYTTVIFTDSGSHIEGQSGKSSPLKGRHHAAAATNRFCFNQKFTFFI